MSTKPHESKTEVSHASPTTSSGNRLVTVVADNERVVGAVFVREDATAEDIEDVMHDLVAEAEWVGVKELGGER